MTDERKPLEVRNRMTARALQASQKSPLDFIPNPRKEGNLFFGCGSVVGYISPKVLSEYKTLKKSMREADDDEEREQLMDKFVDKLQYAECKKSDEDVWIACLMIRGNKPEISFKYKG